MGCCHQSGISFTQGFSITKEFNQSKRPVNGFHWCSSGDETFSAVYIKDDSSRRLVREDLEKKNRQLKEIAWIQSHMIKTP